VYITSQNHSYSIEEGSLDGTEMTANMVNLNDHSIEGVYSKKNNIKSVQFHPEASPGPLDCNIIFEKWISSIRKASKK